MNQQMYFDDSLPAFAALVEQAWGRDVLSNLLFLRDSEGRLTCVVQSILINSDARAALSEMAELQLSPYIDSSGFSVCTADELFDDTLKDKSFAQKIPISHSMFSGEVWLVDRRVVGAEWLCAKPPYIALPRRIVFATIKGGVGRSTALCILASHLAAMGRRVLAIDMDLEAPGLGNMLLPGATLPQFGLLDYLVESNLGELSDEFYVELVAPSWLGGGRGRVDVIPALGQRSLGRPENVLAKIARAYGSSVSPSGQTIGFSDKVEALLQRVAPEQSYDAILIDARAGLHETTAAPILGLGAHVFFFGVNQEQTFAGYDLLFSHISTYLPSITDEWKDRITFVQAKSSADEASRVQFSERVAKIFNGNPRSDSTPENTQPDLLSLQDEFETEWSDALVSVEDDDERPPIVHILNDTRYLGFDPLNDRTTLDERLYKDTFGDFLDAATELLENEEN